MSTKRIVKKLEVPHVPSKCAGFRDSVVAVPSSECLQWEREARERKEALDKKEGRR